MIPDHPRIVQLRPIGRILYKPPTLTDCNFAAPTVRLWKDLNLLNIHIVNSEDYQDFLYRFFPVKVTLFTI